MGDSHDTYSILFHVRRVTTEDAYVSVPVTSDLMQPEPTPDGKLKLDVKALTAAALRISQDPRVEWRVESNETQLHPVQQPKPEDRFSFDPFYFQAEPTEPN